MLIEINIIILCFIYKFTPNESVRDTYNAMEIMVKPLCQIFYKTVLNNKSLAIIGVSFGIVLGIRCIY